MSQQFYDLNFEQLEDRTIRIEQKDYCGESVIIDLHPMQLAHLAHQFAGIASPETLKAFPKGFATRLLRLKDKAFGLFEMLASVPCFPPRDNETEDVIAVCALLDEFDFLIDDFGLGGETQAVSERLASGASNESDTTPQKENNQLTLIGE